MHRLKYVSLLHDADAFFTDNSCKEYNFIESFNGMSFLVSYDIAFTSVSGQNPPGQNPPRTKSPLGQNPPRTKSPWTKSPQYILYFIDSNIFY